MKSFKEILREQEGGRKEFRDLLKSRAVEINIQQQSSDPTKPSTPRRKRNVGEKPAKTGQVQNPTQSEPQPQLNPKQQQAQVKGYRTPEGNITQRGIENYATRRGSLGYGDKGKDPSKYGIDPRQAAADARERTRNAAAGSREARSSIKSDIKKIEAKYPAPSPTTGSQSSFSRFSRKASAIQSNVKTGRSKISTPEMSVKDAKFFKSLESDPVKRTTAKIDAAIDQQADDLLGKKGPQQTSGYRQQGLKDLSKAIDNVDQPSTKPQAKPSKPTPTSKPTASPQPTGSARVTFGQGGKTKPGFREWSRSIEGKSAKAPASSAQLQAVQKIDTARKLATTSGRAARVGGIVKNLGSKVTAPAAAAVEAGLEITDPTKNPSIARTAIKKGSQLAAASQGAKLGAQIGGLAGPWGRAAGAVIGGGLGYAGAGETFEKLAGQTPTEKKIAAKKNRDIQQIQKPDYGDTSQGSFATRPLKTVIKDPKTGRDTVGYLTRQNYQGQEYTGYKAADTSNAARAASSSNPFERIGRTLFPSAYTKSDEENMRRTVSRIKKKQGLGESNMSKTSGKTFAQFMEQAYQQSGPSAWAQRQTERFLRGSDYLANLASKATGKATDFGGSLASGVVKGFTGGRIDPEKFGYDMERFINKQGKEVRKTEQQLGKTFSQTPLQLNPPGSFYPPNTIRNK